MNNNIQNLNMIENPEYVLNMIDSIKVEFREEVFPKYNADQNGNKLTRDADSFYLTGHSPSFARILYECFDKQGEFYEDFSTESHKKIGHAIVKLGEHYYDASGIVDFYLEQYPDNWKKCDSERFYFYQEFNCSKHEHNDEIEQELIEFGKKQLIEMKKNHSDNIIRKLVTKVPTNRK